MSAKGPATAFEDTNRGALSRYYGAAGMLFIAVLFPFWAVDVRSETRFASTSSIVAVVCAVPLIAGPGLSVESLRRRNWSGDLPGLQSRRPVSSRGGWWVRLPHASAKVPLNLPPFHLRDPVSVPSSSLTVPQAPPLNFSRSTPELGGNISLLAMLAEMRFLPTLETFQRVVISLIRGSCPVNEFLSFQAPRL
jgi:hypothetical protein